MTATPPASAVSFGVLTSMTLLLAALGNPTLDPPSLAPPSLPAEVIPAAILHGSVDHVVGLLVRRIED